MIPEADIDFDQASMLGDNLGREEAWAIAKEYHDQQWEDDRPDYYQEIWSVGEQLLKDFQSGQISSMLIPVQYGVLAVFN